MERLSRDIPIKISNHAAISNQKKIGVAIALSIATHRLVRAIS